VVKEGTMMNEQRIRDKGGKGDTRLEKERLTREETAIYGHYMFL
jgi:hypothetical protein